MAIEFFSNPDPNLERKLKYLRGENEEESNLESNTPNLIDEVKPEEGNEEPQVKKDESGYVRPPARPENPPRKGGGFI